MVLREFYLLLTGNPLQNSIDELWDLLKFSDSDTFESKEASVECFVKLTDAKQLIDLHTFIKPYLLWKLKYDTENSLPPKEEKTLEFDLTTIQKTYYKEIYENNISFLFKCAKPGNSPSLMNVMMELRKCCNQLFHVCRAEERILAYTVASVPHKSVQEKSDI